MSVLTRTAVTRAGSTSRTAIRLAHAVVACAQSSAVSSRRRRSVRLLDLTESYGEGGSGEAAYISALAQALRTGVRQPILGRRHPERRRTSGHQETPTYREKHAHEEDHGPPRDVDSMIFVFGSNLKGVHGAGAASHAYCKRGAIWGQGEGLQG